jgi:hypothetical protein
MDLFGLTIGKKKPAEDKSAAFSLPASDDGASVVAPTSGSAYYGVYLDVDGTLKSDIQQIIKYREMALFPEVDSAIQDIVNEAVPNESENDQIEIILDGADISDQLKEKIVDEFNNTLELLDYNSKSSDLFKKWYVDGRIVYHIIVDKANLKSGIVELRPVEATKIRKVKEVKKEKTDLGVDKIVDINEYYLYNEVGFVAQPQGQQPQGQNSGAGSNSQTIKISSDAIIFVPSGHLDYNTNTVLSYLQKAIRPANQLRMLEDATVVYFIARAPERRIFYVDVGNLPKGKAEQYVKDIMNRYRNKMVYDAKTGEVRDDKKYMSMLEDFWMPRRDGGKGTEITTLEGANNQSSMLENVEYFKKKLFESLNVPVSRMQPETGFSLGRSTEISRDEVKFQKFINTLRKKFSILFYETLKTQLILKGICNDLEWEELRQHVSFRFQKDNFFAELKNQDILQARLNLLTAANQFAGIYFSKEKIQKDILMMTDLEIEEEKAKMKAEENDKTATIWGQNELNQPPMPPGMMGDPGADPAGGGDPYAQGDPEAQSGVADDGQDYSDPSPQPQR